MKIIFAFVFIALSSQVSLAASLDCFVKHNGALVGKYGIQTVKDQKVKVTSLDLVTVYVTEKANQVFTVEGFIPDYEMRIYGEGVLRETKDQVVAGLWSREMVLDLGCSLQ